MSNWPYLDGDSPRGVEWIPAKSLGAVAALQRLKLLEQRIKQQPPTDAKFLREFHDVVTVRHPVHGHVPKDLCKIFQAFLSHLPPLTCSMCQFAVSQSKGSQSM